MIWKEREVRRRVEVAAGLPSAHVCSVERNDDPKEGNERIFEWYVSVEGDGFEDDDVDPDANEAREHDSARWVHLSMGGSDTTLEAARVSAESVYRRLASMYAKLVARGPSS